MLLKYETLAESGTHSGSCGSHISHNSALGVQCLSHGFLSASCLKSVNLSAFIQYRS